MRWNDGLWIGPALAPYAQCRDICIRDNIPLVYAPELRTPKGIIRHG